MIDMIEDYSEASEFLEPETETSRSEQFTEISPIIVGRHDSHTNLYKARRYGQWWCLKCLNEKMRDNKQAREILEKEFNVGVGLWHPNIARFIAFYPLSELKSPTIVSEYIDGEELSHYLTTNPPYEEKIKVIEEIIDAMVYYNSKQVVHCDLKPNNILITHNGHNVKIIDFGLASADAYRWFNGIGGNDLYGAPEQKAGNNTIDCRADIYAFGNILKRFQLPNKYNRLIEKCTKHDPDLRYQNPHELKNAFERAKEMEFPWFTLGMVALGICLAFVSFVAGHRWSTDPARDLPTSRDAVVQGKMPAIFFNENISFTSPDKHFSKTFVIPSAAEVIYANNDFSPSGPISEDEAVDLGLSVKWAPFNVGCTKAKINYLGGLYSWGDAKGTHTTGEYTTYWPADLVPPMTLPAKYDVATHNWGGKWRMPTLNEWQELVDRCKWAVHIKRGDVMGYTVTGPSGKSIYLPFAGTRENIAVYAQGVKGNYWTSTTFADPDTTLHRPVPYFVTITKSAVDINDYDICTKGMSVRPVLSK